MIIFLGFYHRKQGMSTEEFRRFWTDVYGPLYSEHPEIKRHLRRYVQHQLSEAGVPGQSSPFDGIAEAWFESAEDIAKMTAEPKYQSAIAPRLAEFVDMERSTFHSFDSPVYQIGEAPALVR